MNFQRAFAACLTLLAALGAWPIVGGAESIGEKASLQAAMQRYIDRQMVDDAFLYLDQENGEVGRLHPVTAHPMILKMGRNYVLCFDFRNDQGADVNVDFYMAPTEGSYIVFHTAIDDREVLHRLMQDGKVTGMP